VATHWLRSLTQQLRPLASRPRRPRVSLGIEQLEERLTPIATTTTLTLGANTILEGTSLRETALVVDSLANPVQVGQVSFTFDGTSESTQRLENRVNIGTVELTLTGLAPGHHTLTANYSQGGPALPDSSAAQQLNVIEVTGVQLGLDPNTVFVAGQPIKLEAFAGGLAPGDPEVNQGSMEFFVDGTLVGVAPVGLGGRASLNLASLPVGAHGLTVRYDGVNGPSLTTLGSPLSDPGSFTVIPATTTTLSAFANPSVFGQGNTFTATVTGPAGSATSPTGTVTFQIDASAVMVPLTGASAGTATA
jgi:hypothetical protein